jgi:calcium/calmodulin-dependent protein kinase I
LLVNRQRSGSRNHCLTDRSFPPSWLDSTRQLGTGAFSVVKEGSNKKTGESYAIKIVTKSKLTHEDEVALKDEIDILQELQHPNIIRLYDVFDEKDFYYLVTEKMAGGELFDRVVQKSYYNEKEARDTCIILFKAMEYCHKKQVAHRDLKPGEW